MESDRPADGSQGFAVPLDGGDPRFAGTPGSGGGERPRRLVASKGPGVSPEAPAVRVLRVLIPLVFAGVVAGIVAVFALGLGPSDGRELVGPVAAVRAAVAERPHRVCLRGAQPCAWLTLVDGELLALQTSGPLPEETGRLGVAWCPSSGRYGSNVSGSRFDALGNVVTGPAPRGLDRVRVVTDPQGMVSLDFLSLTTGLQVGQAPAPVPPEGPDCPEIPFDRDADLDLDGSAT